MSIAKRLGISFGIVIAIFLGVAGISLYTGQKLAEADGWNTHTFKVMAASDGMLKGMLNMETGARGFMLAGKDDFLEPWNAGVTAFDAAWADAKQLTSDNPVQQKRLDDMKARSAEFRAVVTSQMQMRRDVTAGSRPMADFLTEFRAGKSKAAMDGFRATQAEFSGTELSLLGPRGEAAERLRSLNRLVAILGSLFALAASAVVGLWVSRSITRPIGQAVTMAEAVAAGDLTSHVEITRHDEVGQLLAALAKMNAGLVGIVGQVRASSESIATGSSEIATGNADLSQRTEEQASNLQQTAASMEQLTATVRTNSDTARAATELATAASSAAAEGGTAMGQVIATMDAITSSSKKIVDIIAVIDGIAFQTNILALNAAVEAARAGEQGRGFAVVATEVRNLAQRSASAAKEIKSLIAQSVDNVDTGSRQVGEAGRTIAHIVDQVQRVSTLIGEISSATTQQTQGIGQVGDAVNQLDKVTQQNAALVEQSAAAAESLSHQAVKLVDAVRVFKLAGSAH